MEKGRATESTDCFIINFELLKSLEYRTYSTLLTCGNSVSVYTFTLNHMFFPQKKKYRTLRCLKGEQKLFCEIVIFLRILVPQILSFLRYSIFLLQFIIILTNTHMLVYMYVCACVRNIYVSMCVCISNICVLETIVYIPAHLCCAHMQNVLYIIINI